MDEAAVRASLRKIHAADRRANTVRRVGEYQRLFPGFEDIVADEFAALESAESVWEFATRPHALAAPLPPPPPPEAARKLGPYTLLREVGRGGQAQVFLAQCTP